MGSREKMKEFYENEVSGEKLSEKGSGISRIKKLLDEDSFVEINRYAKSRGISFGYKREAVEGDGVIVGYGAISGNLVFVASQDPDVYGGSLGHIHASKISGIIDMAISSNAPFIGIYDSAGTRIEEGILALEGMSDVISAVNRASEYIPTIACIPGKCAGGNSIIAGLSHFRIMTENDSGIYMNGPMVTSAKEGKDTNLSETGGSGVHSEKTGLASFVCSDEEKCFDKIRSLIEYFPGYNSEDKNDDDPNRLESKIDEIAEHVDNGYDICEILELVFDSGSINEVCKGYSEGAITSLGKLGGFPVGIIANSRKRMDSVSALKIKDFINLCERLGLPVISFVDCKGYEIGTAHEHSGIVKFAGELFSAINNHSFPKISVIVGEAIGAAYITLASKQIGFDFVYAWPTAQIAVTTAKTAANILYKKEIAQSDDITNSRNTYIEKYSDEVADARIAASLGHVDEVIMPSSTRARLISSLLII